MAQIELHPLPIGEAEAERGIISNHFVTVAGFHVGRVIEWRRGNCRLFHSALDGTADGARAIPFATDFDSLDALRARLA